MLFLGLQASDLIYSLDVLKQVLMEWQASSYAYGKEGWAT